MRKFEFPVDKFREKDIEYLLDRYEKLLNSEKLTEEMALGVSLCAGIAKAYLEMEIKHGGNS